MSRFTVLVGAKLTGRIFWNQQVEAHVTHRVPTWMADLWLPMSEGVVEG